MSRRRGPARSLPLALLLALTAAACSGSAEPSPAGGAGAPPAADMFTGRGCAFVAPVAGRVDEVTRTDTWRQASDRGADRGGRSVSLDSWRDGGNLSPVRAVRAARKAAGAEVPECQARC